MDEKSYVGGVLAGFAFIGVRLKWLCRVTEFELCEEEIRIAYAAPWWVSTIGDGETPDPDGKWERIPDKDGYRGIIHNSFHPDGEDGVLYAAGPDFRSLRLYPADHPVAQKMPDGYVQTEATT